jgi:redox-sensitive bicupin YhaK (pirin superfamily)
MALNKNRPMPRSLPVSDNVFQGHPGLLFRPARDRFHSRHGWLESWHSFSFAGHFDPRWRGFGPLLVINDDTIAARSGFGMHPHRDMEIITVMLEGVLTHRDSMGNAENLSAGEVQRMSAGTGIVHSEMNESREPCRLLQIWIDPDARGLTPSYGQKRFDIGNAWTPLIDPDRSEGAMAIHRQVRLWRARPVAGQRLSLPLDADAHGWIQMIDGAVEVEVRDGASGSGSMGRGDGLGFTAAALGSLTGGASGGDVLLFELR